VQFDSSKDDETDSKHTANRGKTATLALKNKVTDKAQMPEVRRREVTNR
jgi:hypothetical protein